jgi:hypothetical protein
MRVIGKPIVPPPWAGDGTRDPDNARLGLTERTVIGVNNVYFDIATALRDRFWETHNATDVINYCLAENYRLHGVQPLRGESYLPEAWMTSIRKATILVVPARPDRRGDLLFDRLSTPPNRGQWVVESALIAANLRLTGSGFDLQSDEAMLLVHRNSPGLSGEVAALLTLLGEWNEDRMAMMRTVRTVLGQTGSDLAPALVAMPTLKRFLPHEAYPLPPQRLLDQIDQAQAQHIISHVDMGSYLPATVRLAKFDEDTNAKKGTPRG